MVLRSVAQLFASGSILSVAVAPACSFASGLKSIGEKSMDGFTVFGQ